MDIYEQASLFYARASGEKKIIGKSVFDRALFAVKIGTGSPVGIAQYAVHGREYITTKLAFLHAKRGVKKGSVWIVPLVNPDGALLSSVGISSAKRAARKRLCSINGNADFSLWKANGRGVDLNVNFDAAWGGGEKNVFAPASENFVGEHPFSEPETQALKRFTEEISPDYTVSYHTKGEEIYWYFRQSQAACERDKNLAKALSEATGYPLAYTPQSAGGYKDWCIEKLKIPAFTVEVGRDTLSHPIGEKYFSEIARKNENALDVLSSACARYGL